MPGLQTLALLLFLGLMAALLSARELADEGGAVAGANMNRIWHAHITGV